MQAKPNTRKMLGPEIGAIVEFLDGEEKGRQVPILFTRTIMGRKYGDILVRDLQASGTHAAIEVRKDGFWLIDLESSNGTYVRNQKIRQARIEPEDELRIGFTRFKIILDPELSHKLAAKRPTKLILREGGLTEIIQKEFLAAIGDKEGLIPQQFNAVFKITAGPMKGQSLSYPAQTSFVIGRLKAEINIQDPDVSRKHALVEEDQGQLILRDLGSRNGTYVNGRRVTNTVLKNGDQIKLGTSMMVFSLEPQK